MLFLKRVMILQDTNNSDSSASLRIAYFLLLPAHHKNMEISEQLGAGKNAMHCNKKRTAVRWASQCSALANSMAWIIFAILRPLFCLTARELISSRLQFHTLFASSSPAQGHLQGGCTVGRDCDAVIHLLALGCPAGHNLAVG